MNFAAKLRIFRQRRGLSERSGVSRLLIESFNPEPQATALPETVACGSGLNEIANIALNQHPASYR